MILDQATPGRHEEVARCLFNESNDVLLIFDPREHRVLDANPVALRLTGFTRKALCRLRVWDLFFSPEPRILEQLIEAYKISWFYHSREGLYLNRAQAGPIPVNVSVSRIHTDPQPLGLVVARDISERKKAQETLDRFFRLAPDLFAVLRLEAGQGHFLKVNPAWESTLGYPIAELMGSSPFHLLDPPEAELLRASLTQLSHGRELSGLELQIRHKDGSPRWISLSASLDQGLVNIVARDITEARRAAMLLQAIDDAQRASQAKTHFMTFLAHEIRNPLSAIRESTINLSQSLPPLAHSIRSIPQDIERIRRNVLHLNELLDDLLDLGQLESGTLSTARSAFCPEFVVREAVDMMRAWAEAKGLALVHVPGGPIPPLVLSDRTRLRQILVNLISNAIKFTTSGRIEVELRHTHSSEPPPAGWLEFRVEDTGPGIDPDTLPLLFHPLPRPPRSDRPGGRGLGLAISARLARLLDGHIDVQSSPGHGSRFTLRLPASPVPSDPTSHPPDPSHASPGQTSAAPPTRLPFRLLLAEDHHDLRESMAVRLEALGAAVTSVATGHDALTALVQAREAGQPIQLVLMDLLMPILDGLEATRAIRALGDDVPIVALSAFADDSEAARSLAAGCDAHVPKPVNWDSFPSLLARLVSSRSG